MLVTDFVFSLFAALVLSVVIAVFFGWRHPGQRDAGVAAALGFVFLTVFLAALVGGMWFQPMPTHDWHPTWLPYLGVALIVASVILAAGVPRGNRQATPATDHEPTRMEIVAEVFGGFFWLMMFGFVTALVLAYVF
jgi:hypothetical protein